MISVILPFYNSDKYLEEAVQSVISQSIDNWELLLVNDGSKDNSKGIALSFKDRRIRYFEQENRGVSSARNLGLGKMNGDFFCFLDSDDVLPINSLESRYNLMKSDPELKFVDGRIKKFDKNMNQILAEWIPNFSGNPLVDLTHLTGKSFLGLTWMIRKEEKVRYKFHENLTHSEDLLFFMELARKGGKYTFTNETILHYRDTPNSAMKNLKGLENGYRYIENRIKNWNEILDADIFKYKYKFRRAMFLAYVKKFELLNAINSITS